ncbi:hypothetical protein GTY65_23780 [Streptomyces sp. SID8379]|uniref:hypothetical protein n=1 Tax=unclassified Streptomyces TaxID=2593676 RepID=UPI00037571C1|nr:MULTISPECIES: hypothetical protein [unclassified Streptomyces]MYW67068.1 hypothetical protein [Streptomyces sp. SID8379]
MSDEEPQRSGLLGVEMRRVPLDDGNVVTIVCDAGLSEEEARARAASVVQDNRAR